MFRLTWEIKHICIGYFLICVYIRMLYCILDLDNDFNMSEVMDLRVTNTIHVTLTIDLKNQGQTKLCYC